MRPFTQKTGLLLVMAAGVLLAIPLICCGYPQGTHDGGGHVNWIECFARQLWNGECYPRWFPSPNGGFGTPSFFYYAPLPYYVAAFFWHLAPLEGQAGFAIGWAAALALILSGMTAFWCLQRFVKSQCAAMAGAVIYMAAPYHLAIDLLVRGANAEFWAFVWLPLIIGTLEDLSRRGGHTVQPHKDSEKAEVAGLPWFQEGNLEILRLALWIACLVFTHVLTTITFAPVVAGFALYKGLGTFKKFLAAGLVALGLTAVYWLPLVAYRALASGSEWKIDINATMFYPFLDWHKPLFADDVYNRRLLHLFFGFVLVYLISALAAFRLKFDRRAETDITFWVMALGGCLVMMVPISLPIYSCIPYIRYIQFSWRFMTCATLAHSLLAAFLLDAFWAKSVYNKLSRSGLWLGRMATMAILAVAVYLGYAFSIIDYRAAFYNNGSLRLTSLNADIHERDGKGEYIPIGANMEEAQRLYSNASFTALQPKLLEGTGWVTGEPKGSRDWTIEVQATSPCIVLIHQFWFPGWNASDSTQDENYDVRSEAKSGLVQIEVPPGRHSIDLQLSALGPEVIGKMISFTTTLAICLLLFLIFCKKRTRQDLAKLL